MTPGAGRVPAPDGERAATSPFGVPSGPGQFRGLADVGRQP
jgi:hypothetical protein